VADRLSYSSRCTIETGKLRGWEFQRFRHLDGRLQYFIERSDGGLYEVPPAHRHIRSDIDAACGAKSAAAERSGRPGTTK
jgi:hypothetical protein